MWFFLIPLTFILGYAAFIKGGVESKDFNFVLLGGTYVNRNHFAGLLEMVLPFAVTRDRY